MSGLKKRNFKLAEEKYHKQQLFQSRYKRVRLVDTSELPSAEHFRQLGTWVDEFGFFNNLHNVFDGE